MTRLLARPRFLLALALIAALPACAQTGPDGGAAGQAFLAGNRHAKGVVTTSSGLEYRIVKSGPAEGAHPAAADSVTFDYEGKLLTGEIFDSSYKRGQPITGIASDFVPGFTEALLRMRPGDVWTVWIPPALGYGARASGPIPANSVLEFKLELEAVTPAAS